MGLLARRRKKRASVVQAAEAEKPKSVGKKRGSKVQRSNSDFIVQSRPSYVTESEALGEPVFTAPPRPAHTLTNASLDIPPPPRRDSDNRRTSVSRTQTLPTASHTQNGIAAMRKHPSAVAEEDENPSNLSTNASNVDCTTALDTEGVVIDEMVEGDNEADDIFNEAPVVEYNPEAAMEAEREREEKSRVERLESKRAVFRPGKEPKEFTVSNEKTTYATIIASVTAEEANEVEANMEEKRHAELLDSPQGKRATRKGKRSLPALPTVDAYTTTSNGVMMSPPAVPPLRNSYTRATGTDAAEALAENEANNGPDEPPPAVNPKRPSSRSGQRKSRERERAGRREERAREKEERVREREREKEREKEERELEKEEREREKEERKAEKKVKPKTLGRKFLDKMLGEKKAEEDGEGEGSRTSIGGDEGSVSHPTSPAPPVSGVGSPRGERRRRKRDSARPMSLLQKFRMIEKEEESKTTGDGDEPLYDYRTDLLGDPNLVLEKKKSEKKDRRSSNAPPPLPKRKSKDKDGPIMVQLSSAPAPGSLDAGDTNVYQGADEDLPTFTSPAVAAGKTAKQMYEEKTVLNPDEFKADGKWKGGFSFGGGWTRWDDTDTIITTATIGE